MRRPSGGDWLASLVACSYLGTSPTRHRKLCGTGIRDLRYPAVRETKGEAAMFEMLNEEKHDAESRKLFWMKVGIFVIAVAAMGGVIYMSFYFTS